MKHFMLVER